MLQYNNSKQEAYMEKLGLMNWALIDIWEESQFINFRLSHMSENPELCLRNTWMVPYDNLNMYWFHYF